MISIYNIKPKFQELLKPVLVLLHKLGITANQITISSILLSLIIGIGFWFADKNFAFFLILPFGLLLRMALNALDGMMARTYNQQSKKGEVLNEIGDIISDLFVFFPLLKFEQEIFYLIVIFICLSIINEFAGVLGKVVSNERRYEGPMGKSDRALILGVYGILSYLSINFNKYSIYIFSVIILLLILSTMIRIKKSLK
ncbi:MAG TPA: CDP-alcohol phosphatidyltransferase family protein [Vicingus sp.]|jgi:CDP-diacylglycerol--glycerol-3-phosphate 3-phosphatidyltransferase|nr:CDP-alcohol phosphatidyltransferase family protein [Candidatus Woesebacteria bacterium]HRP60751.1 CDP-alcohol phosphatidyltransferase family protein [Vicingus sp.]